MTVGASTLRDEEAAKFNQVRGNLTQKQRDCLDAELGRRTTTGIQNSPSRDNISTPIANWIRVNVIGQNGPIDFCTPIRNPRKTPKKKSKKKRPR
jgi:hypothetical protein